MLLDPKKLEKIIKNNFISLVGSNVEFENLQNNHDSSVHSADNSSRSL